MCKTRISSHRNCKNFRKSYHILKPYYLVCYSVVNGPGEAAMTDVGITGGKKEQHALFIRSSVKKDFNK